MKVIDVKSLSKKYGSVRAVNKLSFHVEEGQVFGILGPNGSGKTTTLGMLAGVTNPNSGNFKWFGQESGAEVRKSLGIILERPNFYPYMSAYKNLKVVSSVKDVKDPARIDEVLKIVGLYERKDDKFKTYSLGMKQRLSIASALLVDPKVLILDEPTNGLDPQGIAEIRELIIQISRQGKTIILASHLLDEVQKVCTHFMVMRKGDLMHLGPVSDVSTQNSKVEVASQDMAALKDVLTSLPMVKKINEERDFFALSLEDGQGTFELNKALLNKEITVTHLVEKQQSLEQKFLEILSAS